MFKQFSNFFGFSRRELNGMTVLAVILLLLWLSPHLYRTVKTDDHIDLSLHIRDIEQFLASDKTDVTVANVQKDLHLVATTEPEYFVFDPNGLSIVDWKRLGLSERQIRMIKNYEAKGGRFRKPEDVAKIYAISEADYVRLAPYIRIKTPDERPVLSEVQEAVDKPLAGHAVLHLELNTADSLTLQYLPGIGPVFASRIVRFRDHLGGFHHISQLLEVYGFDSIRFDGLKDHVYVDATKVTQISVNTANYEQLNDHPFISPKLANAIVQYRKQHGLYRSLEELLNIAIMDERNFRKIAPYLSISDD